MALAIRKSLSQRKKARMLAKKRKNKPKDPKKVRAARKAWVKNRANMMKGVKAKQRLYQSCEDNIAAIFDSIKEKVSGGGWGYKDSADHKVIVESLDKSTEISVTLVDAALDLELYVKGTLTESLELTLDQGNTIVDSIFQAYSK